MKQTLSVALASVAMLMGVSMTAALADTPIKPSPATSPQPKPEPHSAFDNLKVSGVIRAYSFDREFATGTNQSATNFLAGIHADYTLAKNLSLGASYYGAYPFGINGRNAQFNKLADNSLPASTLSAFPETYLKYSGKRFTATVGNQFLNEKWEPASDVRLMPAAYQGITASYKISPHLLVSADRVIRFEPRTASLFGRYTLFTAPILGLGNGTAVTGVERDTSGALAAHLKYASNSVTALAEDYSFYDIGNLQYLETRGDISKKGAKPFVALQYVGEQNIGKSILGRINAHSYGAQLGANVTRNLVATVAYNGQPTQVSATQAGLFNSTGLSGSPLFAYGGIASPYSNGYSTDPLFTTSLIDDTIEARSTRAFKGVMTYTSDNKRLVFYAARAYFENVGYNVNDTHYETDADVTYYFSNVGKGPYKGLSIRQRYGVRNTPTEVNKSFQQARTQVQYSF